MYGLGCGVGCNVEAQDYGFGLRAHAHKPSTLQGVFVKCSAKPAHGRGEQTAGSGGGCRPVSGEGCAHGVDGRGKGRRGNLRDPCVEVQSFSHGGHRETREECVVITSRAEKVASRRTKNMYKIPLLLFLFCGSLYYYIYVVVFL